MEKVEITQWHKADADLMEFKKYIPPEYPDGNSVVKIAFLMSADKNFDESYNMFTHFAFMGMINKFQGKLKENPNVILYRDENFKDRIDRITTFLYPKTVVKPLPENYLEKIDGLIYIGDKIDMTFAKDIDEKYPNLLMYVVNWNDYSSLINWRE